MKAALRESSEAEFAEVRTFHHKVFRVRLIAGFRELTSQTTRAAAANFIRSPVFHLPRGRLPRESSGLRVPQPSASPGFKNTYRYMPLEHVGAAACTERVIDRRPVSR